MQAIYFIVIHVISVDAPIVLVLDLVKGRAVPSMGPLPDATGEDAGVVDALPNQPQGEGLVLNVAVRNQQQIPDASGRGQQAQAAQGFP